MNTPSLCCLTIRILVATILGVLSCTCLAQSSSDSISGSRGEFWLHSSIGTTKFLNRDDNQLEGFDYHPRLAIETQFNYSINLTSKLKLGIGVGIMENGTKYKGRHFWTQCADIPDPDECWQVESNYEATIKLRWLSIPVTAEFCIGSSKRPFTVVGQLIALRQINTNYKYSVDYSILAAGLPLGATSNPVPSGFYYHQYNCMASLGVSYPVFIKSKEILGIGLKGCGTLFDLENRDNTAFGTQVFFPVGLLLDNRYGDPDRYDSRPTTRIFSIQFYLNFKLI